MALMLLQTVTIPETIVNRKIIIFRSAFGIKAVRKIAEKTKNQMFKRYFLLKSKPNEIKIDTIDKYFEQYVIIDGKYTIEYSQNWKYSIHVDEELQKLKISNKNFEPKLSKNHLELPYKILELNGTGRLCRESQLRIVFDHEWNEVGLERLPYLPFEEALQELPDETAHQEVETDFKSEKEVELLKSKILNRPTNILKIYSEIFQVTERALIFKPMYKVVVSHIKSQKKAVFLIDGGTGKTISTQKDNEIISIKEIKSKVFGISKNKVEQIRHFIIRTLKIKR